MKNLRFRLVLSAVCLASILMSAIVSNAAPVGFNQVLQIIDAKPGKANTGGFAQLRLAADSLIFTDDDDKKTATPAQDGRVIVETRAEIVEDDVCDCELPVVEKSRFPYAWLALGAVPLLFLIPRRKDRTPTPTPPTTETPTPSITPTPTPPSMTPTPPMTPTPTPPGMTPTPPITPTPTLPPMTPTPTPPMTQTPTPPPVTPTPPMKTPTPPTEPVPEPMTILLFGTGLASIGLAARRKFGRKDEEETEE